METQHEKSLRLMKKFVEETPQEEIDAMINKFRNPSADFISIDCFLEEYATRYFLNHLMTSPEVVWYNTLRSDDGQDVKIKRKMCYMSFTPYNHYHYANLEFPGQLFTPQILTLCGLVNEFTGRKFNSVLLNWYNNGKEVINWHSDKEEQLGALEDSVIGCVNLGATRKFWFRDADTRENEFYIPVEDGNLLIMKKGCQAKYQHAILKESDVTEPRISLTFREVI